MTTRIDHTICSHDRTPAGRKACRAGANLVRGLSFRDAVKVDGVVYSINKVCNSFAYGVEVQVRTYDMDRHQWIDRGWVDAWHFAGGEVVR